MLTQTEIQRIAVEMRQIQDGTRQVEPLSSRIAGFDAPAAYAAAHLIHQARVADGAIPVGRKIGFTNPDMWDRYGVREPFWSYMYDTSVRRLTESSKTLALDKFVEPKIEPEIVFHFHATPPVGAKVPELLECLDWFAHGFEIVQSHFPGWKFQAADTVVDRVLHGALLYGEPQPVARLGADPVTVLKSFELSLLCDGAVVETGSGAHVLGNPLAALAHLAAVLTRQPDSQPLQAGEMMSTGTITTAQSVRPGQVWSTRLQGIALAGLELAFVSR